MIVFVSNYFNHHQLHLSNALHMRTNGDYRFIATELMDEERINMGWGGESVPYVLQYMDTPDECQSLIDEADTVIWGSAPYALIKRRLRANKLTFAYSERIYKEPCPSWQIPLRAIKYFGRYTRYKSCYMLCASAYTAQDYAKTRTFIGKTYKWGYFPEAKKYNLEELFARKRAKKRASILWAGRLIGWKHPDASIQITKQLMDKGYDFELNIIGNGEMESGLKQMIAQHGLQDRVHMLGAMKPEQVRKHMECADIYLFTSDRNEGWGAVLNESMNSGCAVVACNAIGSVPYLIRHGENGFGYDTIEELEHYVEELLDDDQLRRRLGEAAYYTMVEQWNAENAAKRLLVLAEELQHTGDCRAFTEGPCSKEDSVRG